MYNQSPAGAGLAALDRRWLVLKAFNNGFQLRMNDLGRHKLAGVRLDITRIEVGLNLDEGASGWIAHGSNIASDERNSDDLAWIE